MNRFKKFILATSCLFIAVFSFLIPTLSSDRVISASADTISSSYTFQGSNVYVPVWRSNGTYNTDTLLYMNKFTVDSNGITIDITNSRMIVNTTQSNYNYDFVDVYTNSSMNSKTFTFNTFGSYVTQPFYCYSSSSFYYNIRFYCNSSAFTGDIYKLSFFYIQSSAVTGSSQYFNVIRYYDRFDNYFDIYFINLEGYVSTNNFNNRTYFLNVDFTDNQIYETGYNAGLLDNQSNIYNQGYNAGSSVGYGAGYDAGLEASNQYSFLSLFGAVLDAPINALKGLLNFEVFGVNLLTLFTGLLTLAIILLVLKLMRGGK